MGERPRETLRVRSRAGVGDAERDGMFFRQPGVYAMLPTYMNMSQYLVGQSMGSLMFWK